MLVIAWIVQLALFVYGGIYTGHNLLITLVTMVPLAGSAVLALIVSEIADKKREEKNEDKLERNV